MLTGTLRKPVRNPMPPKWIAVISFVGCLIGINSANGSEVTPPEMAPQELQVVGRLSFKPIKESSGLVRSRKWPGIYWTHNDSGDQARIFPIRIDGSIVKPNNLGNGEYTGIHIRGAQNIDWEDIALDNDANLYIGDFGNNWNNRRDLGIYVLKEPNPFERTNAPVLGWIPFEYPDQDQYPPPREKRNYDAEALFVVNDQLYVLTKNRGNRKTHLYRFGTTTPDQVNPLVLLGEFDIRGKVTAADVSPDGAKLVVLTYNALWMFEKTTTASDSWLDGKVGWLPFKNGKRCEGVSFSDDAILISNENRDLFRVAISDLLKIR